MPAKRSYAALSETNVYPPSAKRHEYSFYRFATSTRRPLRPCKHCSSDHLDWICPNEKLPARFAQDKQNQKHDSVRKTRPPPNQKHHGLGHRDQRLASTARPITPRMRIIGEDKVTQEEERTNKGEHGSDRANIVDENNDEDDEGVSISVAKSEVEGDSNEEYDEQSDEGAAEDEIVQSIEVNENDSTISGASREELNSKTILEWASRLRNATPRAGRYAFKHPSGSVFKRWVDGLGDVAMVDAFTALSHVG